MAKVKGIVDSEMLAENHDDEIEEIVRKPAEADVGVTVSEGLKKWHTTSKLVSGGALTDVSKVSVAWQHFYTWLTNSPSSKGVQRSFRTS